MPTEGRVGRQIEAAGNGNRNAHTIEKHGKQTTNEQQKRRANEGIEPDGTSSYKTDSSRWLRNVDTSDGIAVAKRRWEEMKKIDETASNIIPLTFDKPIGEGYIKGTINLIKTNDALYIFNDNGDLITSYPKIHKQLD